MEGIIISLGIAMAILIGSTIYRYRRKKSVQQKEVKGYYPEVTINAMREDELVETVKGNTVFVDLEEAEKILKSKYNYSRSELEGIGKKSKL
jgi:MFS superfamily sulfate permease-like transporter